MPMSIWFLSCVTQILNRILLCLFNLPVKLKLRAAVPPDPNVAFSPQSRAQLTSAVETCLEMSAKGGCSNGSPGQIAAWNVSHITDTSRLFAHAKLFDGDLSKWDVSSVKYMSSMFLGAAAFNSDISKWDVSSVQDMYAMFWGATLFKRKLCGAAWVHSKAKKTKMFTGTSGSISLTVCAITTLTAQIFAPKSKVELESAVDAYLEVSPKGS